MATPLQNTLSRTLMNGNLTINGNISVNSTNIALGFQAGNTSQGLNSIAIGSYAGNTNQGAQSVAIGYLSAYNQTGINNTFVGTNAGGTYLATGASNTFIGSATVNTGATTAAGYNNTTLGAGATVSTSYGNTTAIGVGATATASNQIVLGTTAETVSIPGKVGVGTSAPSEKMHVFGAVNATDSNNIGVKINGTAGLGQKCLWMTYNTDHGEIQSEFQGSIYQETRINPYGGNLQLGSSNNATVIIPGKLIQTGAVHISFYESPNLTYYNTAGTQITSGQYTHVSVKFNSVLNNLNWGTPSYLNNAKLIVPYTGLYFIQFTFASTNCDKEVFIGKNSNNIGSSDTIAYCQIGFQNAISISGTAYLAAGDAINIGFYSSISGAYASYGNRSVYNVSMIARTA